VSETCRQCGAEFEQHSGRGRPSRFCDSFCRRLAEFEVRRVMRRLQLADADVDEYDRRTRGLGYWYGDPVKARQGLEQARARKAELEAELAALLARHEGQQQHG
jgi:hypothetical protein